jgi:purine-binding chemotaxis protein CheW
MTEPVSQRVVIVQAGEGLCALPVTAVVETMRPAPARPLAGAPSWVSAVVDLAALLGAPSVAAPARWVVVRCGGRTAALAVQRVEGVAVLPQASAHVPLLQGAASGAVASLRALDRELLVVLEASRLVPEDVLRAAAAGDGA